MSLLKSNKQMFWIALRSGYFCARVERRLSRPDQQRSVCQYQRGSRFYKGRRRIVDPSTDTWYGSDPNNLYSLALTTGEHYNIWFDGSGKKSYTIEVDYVNLTWKPTEIKQINVYGTFNGWSTAKDLMIYNEETGIWSAECDITTIGDGFYFLMNTNPDQINWDWRLYYTSESGLYLSDQNGDNIKPAKEGKYLITLDLNKMEFTMTEITE